MTQLGYWCLRRDVVVFGQYVGEFDSEGETPMRSQPASKAELRQMLEAKLARIRGALEAAESLRDKVSLTEEEDALFSRIKAEAERLERGVWEALAEH